MKFLHRYRLLLLLFAGQHLQAQKNIQTGILVVGGGTGGVAAGIQAARMGVPTLIAEPTVWLGGMLSSAGVSAFDGNHNMPSGIWAAFREELYKLYGGPAGVATGWVSNTLFEPHAADSILKNMVAAVPGLDVRYRYRFQKTILQGNRVSGAVFYNEATKKTVRIYARQVIDATDLGDVMASAGIPFDLGMEASSITGENVNIPESNGIIQDLTYVAILKDHGPAADCTIVKPAGYNPMEFDGCCNEFCSNPAKLTSNVTAAKMLSYGRLPHGKYMLNWPGKGNDSYLNIVALNHRHRQQALEKAKAKTMRFIYFLQTQFGFRHLAIARDEFPAPDGLALIPYHREGRRVQGLVRFTIRHIADPFNQPLALYRTGVAVGDYPIDHHHRENPDAPQHPGFYPVPSYNVPLGALVPKNHDGLIMAEKGISVSNVVNGTTRLQPCTMLTGQAAGALAALAVQGGLQPRQVSVRAVQEKLLEAKTYIMPYYDVKPEHLHFAAIQRIGATGILKGRGEPFQWANRTWFYPDSLVSTDAFISGFEPFAMFAKRQNTHLTIQDALHATALAGSGKGFDWGNAEGLTEKVRAVWREWGLENFDTARPITRSELAVLLDKTINPFRLKPVDVYGGFIK